MIWGGVGWGYVLLLHPHRRVFSRMRGYVMGWGGLGGQQRPVFAFTQTRLLSESKIPHATDATLVTCLHATVATLVTHLHATDATLVARLHATAWRKNLGTLNAKIFLRHLTKFGEDPTSLLAFCRKKGTFAKLNSHDK